jgi:NADH dehydrogenase FAD-containing subunit
MSEAIRSSLEAKGIEVMTGTSLQEVTDTEVITSGGSIPARTVFWAAGITAPSVVRDLPVEQARNGALIVDDHMRLPSHPEVYVIGDAAWGYDAQTGEPLPPTAQAAEQQGRYVARSIATKLRGGEAHPYSFSPRGHLVLLGRHSGVAQLGPVTISPKPPFVILGRRKGLRIGPFQLTGLPAWLLWHGYYLSHIPSWRNRLYLLMDWLLAALTGRETSQLPLMAYQRE